MLAIQNRQYLSVITSSGADIHCSVTYSPSGNGRGHTLNKLTAITAAVATPGTAILGKFADATSPAAPDSAQISFEVKNLTIRNIDVTSQTVTVCIVEENDAGTQTVYEVFEETIAAGLELVYEAGSGWTLEEHSTTALVQSLSSPGAASPSADLVLLTVDGTDAFTLDNGTEGHVIVIDCIAASNTPIGTLTLNGSQAAYGTEPTAYVFTAAGQRLVLQYTSTGWKFMSGQGSETIAAPGALEPAWTTSFLDINGTDAFTLANGIRIGQRKTVECIAAAATPVGTLTLNDAYTGEATAIVFKEIGQKISLEWTAAGWKLLEAFGAESITAAGALDPVWPTSYVGPSGTVAYTLAAGTRLGQRKTIKCNAAAATPLGTVTLADAWSTEPTAWVFTTIGQMLELEWTSTGWKILDVVQVGTELVAGAGTANPLCLIHTFDVNGVDVIQPDAVFAGQRSIWRASAATGAASTISGLFWDEDDSADGIDVNFDAIGDQAVLEWRATRWLATVLVSATVST